MKIGLNPCSKCMNNKNRNHFIQKQVLIFDFSSEEKSRSWHKTASTFYYRNMLPIINNVLDTWFPEDHYCIERLEIDLGEIDEEELQDTLVKIIEQELNRIIKKDLQKPAASIPGGNLPAGDTLFIKENQQTLLENFFYFLDHGILHWNSRFNKISILEAEIKQEIGFKKLISNPAFQQRLQQAEIRRRIYFQFSRSFWEEICNRFYKTETDRLYVFQEILTKILISIAQNEPERKKLRHEISGDVKEWIATDAPSATEDWHTHYIRWAINKVSPGAYPAGESATCKKIIKELISSDKYQQYKETKVLLSVLNSIILSEIKPETLPETLSEIKPATPARAQADADDGPKSKEISIRKANKIHPDPHFPKVEIKPENMQIHQRNKEELTEYKVEITGKHSPENPRVVSAIKGNRENEQIHQRNKEGLTEYYVQQAGVIITWPFLAHLFKHTGYLDNKAFKEVEHQQRAIHLLGFIASGKNQFEEQELVMAKFLCGWSLAMPIAKTAELTDEEKDEAEEMLQNLIMRWSVLKNTSVDGLRDSFFLREGKLLREAENWRLLVEQKSYDMLLDHLPYSISLIRLPWNKDMLKVDWA